MKRLLALALFSLVLGGCSKPAVPFLEVKKKYIFYFENNRNWVMGKVIERTDDGWVLINYDGGTRWINGPQALMINEVK